MKKRLPPLNWLRSFEASARHLNFTQAASELNLTQAAISQQVRSLESQLGAALFKRLPRGVELTDAGMAYLPAIHEAIERLGAVTEEIFGAGRSESLTIRVNLVFFTCWLAPRLHSFRTAHPEVGLLFTSNIWVGEYDNKEADMEVRHGQGAWPGMEACRLTWDKLVPVCSPILHNGSPPPSSSEELSKHTLLHVMGYEEGWGYWFNQTGCSQLEVSAGIQFDTLISALEFAAQGGGVALGRSALVQGMLDSGRLIAPFEQSIPTSEAFYLTYPSHQYLHPDAEVFRNWLLEEAEKNR